MAMESRLTFGFAVDVVLVELFSLSPYVSGHMLHSLLTEFPFITNLSICITSQQTVHHIIPAGIVTVVVSLLILFYDLPLPDELKGFVFFAQVIGLIYRNAPYLVGQNESVSFNHTVCG